MPGHKRTESVKQTPGQQPCNEREPPCPWPEKGWVSVICRERAWLLAPPPSAAHGGSCLASSCSFSLAQVPAKANPGPYQEKREDLWPVTEWLGIASGSQLTVCPTLRSRSKYVLVFFSLCLTGPSYILLTATGTCLVLGTSLFGASFSQLSGEYVNT